MMTIGHEHSVRTYGAIIRRRWGPAAALGFATLLLFVMLAYSLKPYYRSSATILAESSSVAPDVIKSTIEMNEQIELVQGRVLTLATLTDLVKQYDPYPGERQLSVEDKARKVAQSVDVERVDPVTGKPLEQSDAFALHYENESPQRAAAVALRLANLFLTYNQRTRSEAAAEAKLFLAKQASQLDQQVRELDAELARMQTKYGDALQDSQGQNRYAMERADNELTGLQREILSTQNRVSALSIMLSQLSPTLLSTRGDKVDLATLRAQLADAEQHYTPEHPDVKRLRAAIAAISKEYGSGAAALRKPDNPEYLRVQDQLDSTNKELAVLRAQEARARERIERYSQAIRSSPLADKDYAELARRREVANSQYLAVQQKLSNAEQAEVFESEQRGARFTLVRAPFVPSSPYSPNRLGFICLGLVLGGALAAAYIAITESTDPSVRGSYDLQLSDEVPLLGAVPVLLSPAQRRRRSLKVGVVALAYAAAATFVVVMIMRPH